MQLPPPSLLCVFLRTVSLSIFLITVILLPIQAQASNDQLQLSSGTVRFGLVLVGEEETELVTLTNAGATTATISSISVSNGHFIVSGPKLPLSVSAGQTVGVNVSFAPKGIGWVGAAVTFSSNASNSNLKLTVQGTGASSDPLAASPSSIWFGQVNLGSKSTIPVVLKNTKNYGLKLSGFQTSGREFSVSGSTFPILLPPGQTLTLRITFSPQTAGAAGGSVFMSNGINIPLAGTGTTIGQLSFTPTTLSFGNVDVGSSSTQSATVTASGGSVTVSSASSSNSQFTISGTSLPLTISSGQSTDISIVFAPTRSGTDSSKLTLTSNATNSPTAEALSGVGTLQYSVNLSWKRSTSSVVGYNVYRGTTVGQYSKINSTLDPTTDYIDDTVAAGNTYYYAATAVNSAGQESGYSTPLQVVVP